MYRNNSYTIIHDLKIPLCNQGGSEDVKRHKWFRGVDWVGLLDKNVRVK